MFFSLLEIATCKLLTLIAAMFRYNKHNARIYNGKTME